VCAHLPLLLPFHCPSFCLPCPFCSVAPLGIPVVGAKPTQHSTASPLTARRKPATMADDKVNTGGAMEDGGAGTEMAGLPVGLAGAQ
jgi:hypothetical protein